MEMKSTRQCSPHTSFQWNQLGKRKWSCLFYPDIYLMKSFKGAISLHTSQVAYQCWSLFLGIFLLPLDGMIVCRRVTPNIKFAGTHLYTRVKRGIVGVNCLSQEHNEKPRPGLEPGPLDTDSSALTMRPPRLPSCNLGTVLGNYISICI